MNIRIVIDHYAVLDSNGELLGTVERAPEMWGWYPLNGRALWPIPLHYALDEAKKFCDAIPTPLPVKP